MANKFNERVEIKKVKEQRHADVEYNESKNLKRDQSPKFNNYQTPGKSIANYKKESITTYRTSNTAKQVDTSKEANKSQTGDKTPPIQPQDKV